MEYPEISTTHHHIAHYRELRLLGEGSMGVVYGAVSDNIGISASALVLHASFVRNMESANRFLMKRAKRA